MWVGGQRHAPDALPREIDPVTIVQQAVWTSGAVWKISPPTWFEPRTVKSVAIRIGIYVYVRI